MDVIDENLIKLNMTCANSEQAIRELGTMLFESGRVKSTYVEAVVKREKTYPTGLPGPKIGVAIPHTDSNHVNESAIAIGILAQPVVFHVMGNPTETLPVEIVIMLAVESPEKQLGVLRKLAETFQDGPLLQRLKNATSQVEVCKLLERLNANQ